MLKRDVIVIGASAGGVEALAELAHGLPADLPAVVFVVLHLTPDARSNLPGILKRAGPLPASHAVDGGTIHPGQIYIAPPNRHLLLEGDQMHLSIGPRVNSVRPSIDVLFRSAARTFDARVVGIVLSGNLDDGTLGLDAIRRRGGIAVVQDPEEARFSGMPRSAIERVDPAFVLPVAEIPTLIRKLTGGGPEGVPPAERSKAVEREVGSVVDDDAAPLLHEKCGEAA